MGANSEKVNICHIKWSSCFLGGSRKHPRDRLTPLSRFEPVCHPWLMLGFAYHGSGFVKSTIIIILHELVLKRLIRAAVTKPWYLVGR
jgi:hypothetical protein